MKTRQAGLLLGMLAASWGQAAEPAAATRDVVAFNASVRVEVDATGKPVKVEAPADLPEAIRGYIEKRVASWHYAPAKQGGIPASAVTFVAVGACAIPVAEGYRLGLDFKGNGPRLLHASGRMPPPQYPFEALRKGLAGTFKVGYAIQPDGSTTLDVVETLEGGNKLAKLFHPALKQWVDGLKYEPEQVNGRAVATTMSFPVEFHIDMERSDMKRDQWRESYRAELQARAIASSECIAASGGDGMQPIAQNSPVTVTPTPAG